MYDTNTQVGFTGYKTGAFKPLSGLLNQFKYIPVRFCPLTIELALVNNVKDAAVTGIGTDANVTVIDAGNTTTAWEIQNVMVKCDVITLDSALDNSISKHLLDGNTLSIGYSTFIFQEQQIAGAEFSVNVNRAVSVLKSVFMNFVRTLTDAQNGWILKPANCLYHPMLLSDGAATDPDTSKDGNYNSKKEIELQLQLGSKLYPEYPIISSAEAFYKLKKGLGIVASPLHGFHMEPVMYRSTHFSTCFDLEAVLDANFTGINTRSGELLTVRGKPLGPSINTGNVPQNINIILYAQYTEVSASGVTVYD